MKIPTHVVIDTHDGWTFWKDADNRMFTERTATSFAALRNSEMKPEHRSYVVATVTPVESPELSTAVLREQDTPPMIEATGKVCISCEAPMGEPHRGDCVVRTGTLRRE